MNPIKLFPILAVAATGLATLPAQAFQVNGDASYTTDGLPTTLSVDNESGAVGDLQFTFGPNSLDVGSLNLNGSLGGPVGSTNTANYSAVGSYLTGFQFLGQEAVFNLNAGQATAAFTGLTNFTVSTSIAGSIVNLSGEILGSAEGNLIAFGGGDSPVNSYTLNLTGTEIPTPALLPGIIGLTASILRKRKENVAEEA